MQLRITKIFGFAMVFYAISCAVQTPKNLVRFAHTADPSKYQVYVDGLSIGIHTNLRGADTMCGHVNPTRTWLVIEDGCGGDSYPNLTAYEIRGGCFSKSQELERISKEHDVEYSRGRGIAEPVFLGFAPSGHPLIHSATGTHILRESSLSNHEQEAQRSASPNN